MPADTPTGFKDHFSGHAAGYAMHRPTYPSALVDWLATVAPAHSCALDVGCGTGQLSVLLADAFDEVIAIDASAPQIAAATPHPRVAYRTAPAEASGLPGSSVDLVTAAQAAHWFDLPLFYDEVRRIARPGAVLALISYGVLIGDADIDATLQRFYWDDIGRYWPPERKHVEAGYRTLPFPFVETEAPSLAIEVSWSRADLLGYVDTWSAVRAMESAAGRGPLDRFAADLAAAWGDPERRRTVRFPIAVRSGRVA